MEINIKLVNYKLFAEKELSIDDSNIIIIAGPNEIGKSSIITALKEAWAVKGFTPNPLKDGTEKGYTSITGPDSLGNPITIVHNFDSDNTTGNFYALDSNGKTIASVTKIRELIGTFKPISLEEVYYMLKSAEGRRMFAKEYIYPLIPEDVMAQINDINTEINERNGTLYIQRRELNSKMKFLEKQYQEIIPFTNEDHHILKNGSTFQNSVKELKDRLNAIQKDKDEYTKAVYEQELISSKIDNLKDKVLDLGNRNTDIQERIQKLSEEIVINNKAIAVYNKEIDEYKGKVFITPSFDENEEQELKESIDAGERAIKRYDSLVERQVGSQKLMKEISDVGLQTQSLTDSIEEKRDHIKTLLSSADTPAGLLLEDDVITLNGFDFSDTQISESTAKLILAELLCKLSSAKFIMLGNADAFDKNRLNDLFNIAQANNKIAILEKVDSDSNEIKVITNIYE